MDDGLGAGPGISGESLSFVLSVRAESGTEGEGV